MTVQVSVVAPNEQNSEFEGYIRVENQNDPNDFDLIPVIYKTPVNIMLFITCDSINSCYSFYKDICLLKNYGIYSRLGVSLFQD